MEKEGHERKMEYQEIVYQLIKNEGVEPLLYKAPTLEPIIEILDKAIISCF